MGGAPSRRAWFVVFTMLIIAGPFGDVAIGGQLTATWIDNSAGELGFSIERSTGAGGPFVEVGVTDAGLTAYTDATVPTGTTYCYRVRGFGSTDYSEYSNVACATAGSDVLFAVVVVGSGDGTVISHPPGIVCGATCSGAYASGTVLTLTATPATGSDFTGWSDSGCTGTGPCTMRVMEAATVTAAFEPVNNSPFSTLSIDRSGKGTVISVPPGINCGRDCAATYPTDIAVILIATPFSGAKFIGWSGGGCRGTDSCIVTLTGAMRVNALFRK